MAATVESLDTQSMSSQELGSQDFRQGMYDEISASTAGYVFVLQNRAQQAKLDGQVVTDFPLNFEDAVVEVETRFADGVVDGVVALVRKANALAEAKGGSRIKRVMIRSDIDGTLVPWGYESRWDLRPGFIPAVRQVQAELALEDVAIEVKVAPISDRAQQTLKDEVPNLLPDLRDDGTLLDDEMVSAKDGPLVVSMPASLRTQYTNETDKDGNVVSQRIAAVARIMTAEAVIHNDGYHEKVAIIVFKAYGPDADPSTVHFVLDDLGYAGEIDDNNARVGGMHVKFGTFEDGGLQPLSPDDVGYFGGMHT
jgi:hypothetical protein